MTDEINSVQWHNIWISAPAQGDGRTEDEADTGQHPGTEGPGSLTWPGRYTVAGYSKLWNIFCEQGVQCKFIALTMDKTLWGQIIELTKKDLDIWNLTKTLNLMKLLVK